MGKGSGDLLDEVVERLPPYDPAEAEEAINVAVVGRPNAGKSSVANRLLGEERHLVAPAGRNHQRCHRSVSCDFRVKS